MAFFQTHYPYHFFASFSLQWMMSDVYISAPKLDCKLLRLKRSCAFCTPKIAPSVCTTQ